MLRIDLIKASESNNASYALQALLSPDKKKRNPISDLTSTLKSQTGTFSGIDTPLFRGRNSLFEKTASFGGMQSNAGSPTLLKQPTFGR